MKKLLYILFFQLLYVGLFAQVDNQFWFAAPDVDGGHGDVPIFVRFMAIDQGATVTISQPSNPNFLPINIFAPTNTIQSIDLTGQKNLLENQPANSILNKGLLIESDSKILAYYEVGTNNAEIFGLKGRNALGKNFRIPAQNEYLNHDGRAEFDIVATENNTQITIIPTEAIIGHPANVPFTITLNKGQSYAAKAIDASANGTLAGTLITANKKIAVTTIDDSLFSGNAWDLIGDQIVPINVLGTSHIAINGGSNVEKVYIVATEDNTNLNFNGQATPTATINAGDLFMEPIAGNALFIESDKPVYVMHLSGYGDELADALLPPINCTGTSNAAFFRTNPQDLNLLVVTESGNEGNFAINNNSNLLLASDFQPVTGTNGAWVFAKKSFSLNEIPLNASFITNSSGLFHVGVLSSTGLGATYGYFSDYKLDIGTEDVIVCDGEDAVLQINNSATSILWSTGSTSPATVVNQPGDYWVTATVQGCIVSDTVTVTIDDEFANAGNDTIICIGDEVQIGTSGFANNTYTWTPSFGLNNTNIAKPIASPTETTIYTLITSNENNCLDTSMVTVQLEPTFTINNQQDETISFGQDLPITINLSANIGTTLPSNITYNWSPSTGVNNPNSNNVILSPTETTTYTVMVISPQGCPQSITFTVDVIAANYGIPNAFAPNGKNTHFSPIVSGDVIVHSFQVFNRWGQLMYDNATGAGWDGTVNGKEQPQDTYIYVVEIQMSDGQIIPLKGGFLLVR